jgi:acetyltransferase-like isoleucine patch superfamily enzyme
VPHDLEASLRSVTAVHGVREVLQDPAYETGLRDELCQHYDIRGLTDLYRRFANGDGVLESTMRRVLCRALMRHCGNGLHVESNATFKHIETIEVGDGVFIGNQANIQGRFDGRCVIGNRVWIGPQSYFDARDLVLEDDVGWGPGAKVLGSQHTGQPLEVPIIATDLEIRPVRVEERADIGTNAVLLPGVTIGKGAIVGAGAVVTKSVLPFAVVSGVPAKFLHWRKGYKPQGRDE